MDDPQALSNFVKWGQSAFNNTYYYLAVADHGQGILGINWDYTSDKKDNNVSDDSAYLSVKELYHALSDPGIKPIQVLHLDACSMNLLETAYELRGIIKILVASQYLAWSYFGYDQYATAIQPTMAPAEVARIVVDKYAAGVQGSPYTIAALNLAYADPVTTKLNELATALRPQNETDKTTLQNIRKQVQTLVSDFDNGLANEPYDIYIDLKDWVDQVKASNLPNGKPQADALLRELSNLTLSTKSSSSSIVNVAKAQGVSIIYPYQRQAKPLNEYLGGGRFAFATVALQWVELVDGLQSLAPGTPPPPTAPIEPLPPQSQTVSGDCNGDSRVDAGDLSAIAREIFDGDGAFWLDVGGGTYKGAYGCDANQDTQILAGDLSCTAILIFNRLGTCRLNALATDTTQKAATLAIPDDILVDGNGQVQVPIIFSSHGENITGIAFTLRFDPTHIAFHDLDQNNDGLPDAILFNLPTPLSQAQVLVEAQTDTINVSMTTIATPTISFTDGVLLTITFDAQVLPADATIQSKVVFASEVAPSAGNAYGANTPVTSKDGSIWIKPVSVATRLYLPLIRTD